MKEDAVQMVQDAAQASWLAPTSAPDDMQHVISSLDSSAVLQLPQQQQHPAGQPAALAWMQEELGSGVYENSSLLEQNPYAIVNVTREFPFECAMIMFGYIMPFVLVITLITNSLVIVVLSRRHMRTPTNIVLMTMAIVDIGTLASPSPWYLYIYTLGNHDKFLYPPSACYAHYVMTDVIPIFLHTSSIWLALLLASQRYIYVCHPTLARTWCTKPRVKKAIYTILLVAFLHQSTHFADNTFKPTRVHSGGRIQNACRNEMAPWVSELGDTYYYLTYFTFRIFFVFLIPCLALILLNYLLFRALRRAEKKRTELLRRKFKLVGAHASGSVHHTARSQRAGQLQPNNFSTFEPSSYTLAARLLNQRDNLEQLVSNTESKAKQTTAKAPADAADNESCNSARSRKSSSPSLDLEAATSRRASSTSTKPEEGDDSEGPEDESTCAECAALRADTDSPSCRRCSVDETETTTARERHQHHHRASQCSSIMGGATNEEDVSSLTTNQQHQRAANGSLFGHSDCAGARSNLDDSDEEAGLNLSLGSTASGEPSAPARRLNSPEQHGTAASQNRLVGEKMDEIGMIKNSSSAESRLVQCGCLLKGSKALRRVRLLRKSKLKPETGCYRLSLLAKDSKGSGKVRLWDRSSSRTPASQPTICTTPEIDSRAPAGRSTTLKSAPDQRPASMQSFVQVRVEQQQQQEGAIAERRISESNKCLFAPSSGRTKSPSFASSMGRASRASLAGSAAAIGAPLALAPTASQHHHSGRTMDSNRTTLMLIVVVTVFLVVEVPVAAVTIMHVVLNSFEVFRLVDINSTLNYIKLFTNFFIMISYSINFTIYCSMSKKFRETFRDLFCWGRYKRKCSGRMMYQTQAQPNEFATVTPAPNGPSRQLASPKGFAPANHAQLNSSRPFISRNNAHQRSNSLKPVRLQPASGKLNVNGRLHESEQRVQCSGALFSDYLATATTTLSTLDARTANSGQQQTVANGGAGDNTSNSSASDNSSELSVEPAAESSNVTLATRSQSERSQGALMSGTATAFKLRCKSMLSAGNGSQTALPSRPQCEL